VRNSDIAELLARAAEYAKQPLQRALRRAALRSFLWPEEAEDMVARGQSLTELAGIGPYLNKQILDWMRHLPELEEANSEIRQNFLTLGEARALRSKYPQRFHQVRGDLQASIVKSRRAVAVLGFRDLSGRPEDAWLSTALAEMLNTELAAGEKLRLIPGEDVARAKLGLLVPVAETLSRDTLARLVRMVCR
jgi:hypothetical protein